MPTSWSLLNLVLVNLLLWSLKLFAPWWWVPKLLLSTQKTNIKNLVTLSADLMCVSLLILMSVSILSTYQKSSIPKMLPMLYVLTSLLCMVFSVSCSVVPKSVRMVSQFLHFPLMKKLTSIRLSLILTLVPALLPIRSLINPLHLPLLISMTPSLIWEVPAHNSPNVFVNTPLVLLRVFFLSNPILILITKWSSSIFVTSKMNFVQLPCISYSITSGILCVLNKNAVFSSWMRLGNSWNMMTRRTSFSPSLSVLVNIISVSLLLLRTSKTSWVIKWVVPSSWTLPCSSS